MPYGDEPGYDDVGGGLPPDWQPDPNWQPPPHWGYDEPAAVDVGAPPDPLAAEPAPPPDSAPLQPGIGAPAEQVDAIAGPPPPPIEPPAEPPPAPDAAPPPGGLGMFGAGARAGVDALGQIGQQAVGVAGQAYDAAVAPERHYQQTVKEYGDAPFDAQGNVLIPDAKEAQRYFSELQQRDRPKYETLKLQLNDIRHAKMLAEEQRIANENLAEQQRITKRHAEATAHARQKTDEVMADAERLAKEKIDPTGGLNAGQKIFGVLGAIIGGIVQGRTGSARNAGVDALNDMINRGIAAQKEGIANRREGLGLRRNAIAEEYARNQDDDRTDTALRLAGLEQARQHLATEAQNYASGGTTMMRIADMQGAIVGQQQQALQAYQQKRFENNLKVSEARDKEAARLETARHNRAEEGIAWKREAREGAAAKADNTLLTAQQIHERFPALPVEAIPPAGATIAQLGKNTEVYNRTLDTADKALKLSPAERNREFTLNELVDQAGKPIQFRGTALEKLSSSKAAVDKGIRLIDNIVTARQKYGWSSDLVRSPEWRQVQADYTELQLNKKEYNKLGVIAGPDMGLLEKSLGTADPTEIRDPTDGLLAARSNFVNGFNSEVQANTPADVKPARWAPPPPPEVHRETPGERAAKEVLEDPTRDWGGDRWKAETGLPVSDFISSEPGAQARVARWRAETGGLLPSQRSTLDGWASDLRSPDPKKRDVAAANLENAANVAERPEVRAMAQQILTNNVASSVGAEPAAPLPDEASR